MDQETILQEPNCPYGRLGNINDAALRRVSRDGTKFYRAPKTTTRPRLHQRRRSAADLNFETIFVTAFSEYSLKALNQSAAYYLLKPISIEELIVAVNKVQQHIVNQDVVNRNKIIVANFKEPKPEKQQIILPTIEGFEVVKIEHIIRLKANGNFSDIYLADGSKKMVCRFLKYFSEILPSNYIRIHKSHIVNINFIKSYNKGGTVMLIDGSELEISSTYKDDFLRKFK